MIEPFREVLQNNVFDILAIQETKIDYSFPNNQFRVNMYRLYRQDYDVCMPYVCMPYVCMQYYDVCMPWSHLTVMNVVDRSGG